LLYILFEGLALLIICRAFGYKRNLWQGYIYSSADIYFSAITPSATGGQPASAYFMVKDGMSKMMVTTALIMNLCMYTLSILVVGIACFIFRFNTFFNYSLVSQVFIVIGFVVQCALAVFFIFLFAQKTLLHTLCSKTIHLLCKLRLLRREEQKQSRLNNAMERYHHHAQVLAGHKKTMFFVFLFNLLQRFCHICVTSCAFLATGGSFSQAVDIWFLQGYVVIGSYCVPIPGAMGISDYLLLDGFGTLMDETSAVHLELLARSFSFYFCIILCGISVLLQYFVVKKRGDIV
ncbi:MAG: flippase-like domain-containing protein, partial [Clostridia bacterium]|nr:flippase-like domain-containing protein [Clostridia bacterium]